MIKSLTFFIVAISFTFTVQAQYSQLSGPSGVPENSQPSIPSLTPTVSPIITQTISPADIAAFFSALSNLAANITLTTPAPSISTTKPTVPPIGTTKPPTAPVIPTISPTDIAALLAALSNFAQNITLTTPAPSISTTKPNISPIIPPKPSTTTVAPSILPVDVTSLLSSLTGLVGAIIPPIAPVTSTPKPAPIPEIPSFPGLPSLSGPPPVVNPVPTKEQYLNALPGTQCKQLSGSFSGSKSLLLGDICFLYESDNCDSIGVRCTACVGNTGLDFPRILQLRSYKCESPLLGKFPVCKGHRNNCIYNQS